MRHRIQLGYRTTRGALLCRCILFCVLAALTVLTTAVFAANDSPSRDTSTPSAHEVRVGAPVTTDHNGYFLLYPGDEPLGTPLAQGAEGYFDLTVSSDDFCTLVSLTFGSDQTVSGTGRVYYLNVTGASELEHLHSYRFGNVTHTSCNDPLTMRGACTCGKTAEITVQSLHHMSVHITPAACTEAGRYDAVCALCGYSTETPIPPTGHTLRYPQDGITESDHTAQCIVCGAVEHKPHDLSAWETVQTVSCEAPAVNRYFCVCGYTEDRESIPPMGHQWDSGTIVASPTPDTDGTLRYTCTACGATRDLTLHAENGHHHWSYTVTRRASCTESGQVTAVCDCGEILTFAGAPAAGHRFSDWGGTEGQYSRTCHVCGYEENAASLDTEPPVTSDSPQTEPPATAVSEDGKTDPTPPVTDARGDGAPDSDGTSGGALRVVLIVLLVVAVAVGLALLGLFLLVLYSLQLRKRRDPGYTNRKR